MSLELAANFAQTVLGAPLSSSATTLTLFPGFGALFPSPTAGQFFRLTLTDSATNTYHEIVLCTNRSLDTLTISRAAESTSALNWIAGDIIKNVITNGTLVNLQTGAMGIIPVNGGGTGVTVSSGANSVVLRDANANVTANAFFIPAITTTASGSPIIMTAASASQQAISGSGGQIFNLPDATTLPIGAQYIFNNNQTAGNVTVYSSTGVGGGVRALVLSGGYSIVNLLTNAVPAGTWDLTVLAPANVQWSTNTFIYPGTLSGTTWNGVAIGVAYGGTGTAGGYTVGTLPTVGTVGRRAWVTNALLPTFGSIVTAGGSVIIPVFDNGTNWIVG